jgi:hypothetical protein
MSYIRCLYNPEGLYIWADEKYTNITISGKTGISQIPVDIFEGLIKKYHKNFGEDTKYKGASIEQVFVKSGKKPNRIQKMMNVEDGRYQMRLSYNHWCIDMWLVTWEYIAQHGRRH